MINPLPYIPVRLRKTIKIVVIVLVSLFVLDFLSIVAFSLTRPAIPNHVDAVVVLGAKVGTPALTQRTLTGLSYYEAGKTDTIVLSGGQGPGEPISEAQAMENVIIAEIAEKHEKMPRLILDTHSSDTFENLANTKALIPNARTIIIATDGFHLERSFLIAKHDGFQHVYWASPAPTYYNIFDLTRYYLREAVALIVEAPQII
jgi:uncharacterized SAM-binding protein YcdF (DUF218 family)